MVGAHPDRGNGAALSRNCWGQALTWSTRRKIRALTFCFGSLVAQAWNNLFALSFAHVCNASLNLCTTKRLPGSDTTRFPEYTVMNGDCLLHGFLGAHHSRNSNQKLQAISSWLWRISVWCLGSSRYQIGYTYVTACSAAWTYSVYRNFFVYYS